MFSSRQINSKASKEVIRQRSAFHFRCVHALLVGLTLLALQFSTLATRAADEATTRPVAAPADHAAISHWFSELASADPAAREHARDRLMRLSRNDLPELQQLLRQSPHPAPSQIVALRQIVQEIYLAGEPYDKDIKDGTQHGFLGIMMDQDPTADVQQPNDNGQAPGIIVAGRFPGFCAARMLRDGDVILASLKPDNTPEKVFNNVTDLQQVISGAEPGSIVRLQVLRQGQIIQVHVTLDCRPLDATAAAVEGFCRDRAEKFDEYWRETFAPLLKESVS